MNNARQGKRKIKKKEKGKFKKLEKT